ncbi:hypothetical protein EJB05_39240, partial [Eragrostis curvula]
MSELVLVSTKPNPLALSPFSFFLLVSTNPPTPSFPRRPLPALLPSFFHRAGVPLPSFPHHRPPRLRATLDPAPSQCTTAVLRLCHRPAVSHAVAGHAIWI